MKIVTTTIIAISFALFSCNKNNEEKKVQAIPVSQQPKPNIDLVLDIKTIAGKNPEEVSAVLGPPSETSETKHGRKQVFDASGIEIIYINGLSDWITINNMGDVSYSDESLKYLGFPDISPTFSNQFVKRWENIPGFLEVSINPGESGRIHYVQIKIKTK
jgi:hypothetical protein